MNVQIRQRHVEITGLLRAHVERRLGFALGRFGDKIGRVIVRVSDTTERRDAAERRQPAERRCQIDVGMRRSLRVEGAGVDLFTAVDGAAERASRSVARFLERERELRLDSRRGSWPAKA
jgi:putative sigma-54 modulation protein